MGPTSGPRVNRCVCWHPLEKEPWLHPIGLLWGRRNVRTARGLRMSVEALFRRDANLPRGPALRRMKGGAAGPPERLLLLVRPSAYLLPVLLGKGCPGRPSRAAGLPQRLDADKHATPPSVAARRRSLAAASRDRCAHRLTLCAQSPGEVRVLQRLSGLTRPSAVVYFAPLRFSRDHPSTDWRRDRMDEVADTAMALSRPRRTRH